jgi:hypothetical protein
LIPGVGLVLALAPRLGIGLLAIAVIGVAFWLLTQCRHPGRLGLLPPTVRDDGTREPARWFCDQCGKSWPAAIEHESTPIVRYSGFDQTKAPAAARRADEADRKRQALAVRRATRAETGPSRSRQVPETTTEGRPTVVAIAQGRRDRSRPASSA